MSGFLKKAVGLFVEFEDTKPTKTAVPDHGRPAPVQSAAGLYNSADLDKFEKHFEKLFDQTNLPGPDYFEFWKMMETLEKHIPDEKARISATFAALSVQGLTKQQLIDTAHKYKTVIEEDKTRFENTLAHKAAEGVEKRRHDVRSCEENIVKNSELIQKLTREIGELQHTLARLKTEITEEENKLARSKQGYTVACNAMINKILNDVDKIQTTL
jgi:DNA repair exonuclease SbcCD ATPase subunit